MDQICMQWNRKPNVIGATLKCVIKHAVSLVWERVRGWHAMLEMMGCWFQVQMVRGALVMRTMETTPSALTTMTMFHDQIQCF